MSFCFLEGDEKTFDYLKRYVETLEHRDGTCFDLDNEIQAQEIRNHLLLNGHAASDVDEKIRWINRNGKPFRDYLNTIKLAYIVWKCSGKAWKDIRWEDFVVITEELNKLKPICLDFIR